uniref:Uncharacterized protein n=1 Tax=Yersinia enterocolitica TaxID=630 RepID=F2Q856_YEREN|nr:hypothetical protein Y69_0020 [Yersinia enterocolitica]
MLSIQLHLVVPVQNLLGTHLRDVFFPNFTGLRQRRLARQVVNRYALADKVFERKNKLNTYIGTPYNNLKSHVEMHNALNNDSCNEVLLIGRPNLRLYRDFPATTKILLDSITYCLQGMVSRLSLP